MASSLNGLSVGDSLNETLMESLSRSEGISSPREDLVMPYSPMSEDFDVDPRFCDAPTSPLFQHDAFSSSAYYAISPFRRQKPLNGGSACSNSSYPPPTCTLPSVSCSHPRHRGSDSEGRFPSSPNDVCHAPDLRRAALLRSVKLRAQPSSRPPLYEHMGQESMHSEDEGDQELSSQHLACMSALDDPDHSQQR